MSTAKLHVSRVPVINTKCLYTRPAVWCSTTVWLYKRPKNNQTRNSVVSFFLLCPQRPSPFFLYIPSKLSYNDKVWTFCRILVTKRVKSQQMGKKLAHPWTPLHASAKIPVINAIQPFYGCQRNAHKNITVTVLQSTFTRLAVWKLTAFGYKRKGKEAYLYSTFYILCISQSAQAWITQFYLQIHHACLSFVCVH